jgi:hypothetical protein
MKALPWALATGAIAAIAASAPVVLVPTPAGSQAAVELVVVDVAAVARGYRTSKLSGSDVRNDRNERIGEIDDVIIDRERATFAVLEVGGFLGIGGHLVAVPFKELQIDEQGRNIKLPGASKEALQKLPLFKYAGT